MILRQSGTEISGAILRVDGDTGTLTGSFKDGKFVLSHFSGSRPALLILKPASDGTMDVSLSGLHGFSEMKAVRPAEARAKGLPEPTDADLHTTVKDPNAAVRVQFSGSEWQRDFEHRPAFSRQGRADQHHGQLVPELPRRSAVPRSAVRQVSRPGARDCRAVVRGSGSAEEPDAAQGVHQRVRDQVHRAAGWRNGFRQSEADAGRQLGCLADDVLRGKRRPGARRACRFPQPGQRRVVQAGERRNRREGGEIAGGESDVAHGRSDSRRSCFFRLPKLPILAIENENLYCVSFTAPKSKRRYSALKPQQSVL